MTNFVMRNRPKEPVLQREKRSIAIAENGMDKPLTAELLISRLIALNQLEEIFFDECEISYEVMIDLVDDYEESMERYEKDLKSYEKWREDNREKIEEEVRKNNAIKELEDKQREINIKLKELKGET